MGHTDCSPICGPIPPECSARLGSLRLSNKCWQSKTLIVPRRLNFSATISKGEGFPHNPAAKQISAQRLLFPVPVYAVQCKDLKAD